MPMQVVHLLGNFMRIWSVYSLYRYLVETGASVALFTFLCLVVSSICFLLIQKPWKGRPLSNTQVTKMVGFTTSYSLSYGKLSLKHVLVQVVPSIINGAITALYFVFLGKGLKSCGPLRYSPATAPLMSLFIFFYSIEGSIDWLLVYWNSLCCANFATQQQSRSFICYLA